MKKTAKKTAKKPSISKRKLAAYGLGIGGCGAMLAGSAEAVLVDVSFLFESLPTERTLTITDGDSGNFSSVQNGTGTGSAGVGRTVWKGGQSVSGFDDLIILSGTYNYNGFYQAGSTTGGARQGKAVYAPNNVDITFGDGTFSASNSGAVLGAANFVGYDGHVIGEVTGVIGFKTFSNFTGPVDNKGGHWGYVEFSWKDATSTLEILSAKVETTLNTAITFEATAVPEANPATLMALFSLGAVGLRTARRRKATAVEA